MASSKSRKRRKRRPRTPPERAAAPAEASETQAEPAGRQAARRGSVPPDSEAPPAPWGSFPLVELCVLAGIVMLILGFFVVGGSRGPILIAAGLALGSIGGLELSIREHFAGYKSHTAVLAGVPALIVLGLLFYLEPDGLPPDRAGGHRRGGVRGRRRVAGQGVQQPLGGASLQVLGLIGPQAALGAGLGVIGEARASSDGPVVPGPSTGRAMVSGERPVCPRGRRRAPPSDAA